MGRSPSAALKGACSDAVGINANGPELFLARKFSAAIMGNAFDSVGAPSARRLALMVVFVAYCTSAGGAADAADSPAPAPEKLQLVTESSTTGCNGRLPGVAILIQQHGRPVYLKCFGVRDVTSQRPMTPDTILPFIP